MTSCTSSYHLRKAIERDSKGLLSKKDTVRLVLRENGYWALYEGNLDYFRYDSSFITFLCPTISVPDDFCFVENRSLRRELIRLRRDSIVYLRSILKKEIRSNNPSFIDSINSTVSSLSDFIYVIIVLILVFLFSFFVSRLS